MSDYLYELDADRAIPGPLTMGPWNASAQHGGPPSALLGYLIEQLLEPGEQLGRLHVDLLTGLPLETLRWERSRRQLSRRVGHGEASLSHEGRVVARARGLIVGQSELPPSPVARRAADLPDPATVAICDPPTWWSPAGATPFHSHAVEHRFVSGDFDKPGDAVDWTRLTVPVVAGSEPTGCQRVAAVADLGSGISAVYDPDSGVGMINADLNIAFVGRPSGEWFCLMARTHVTDVGTGLAVTQIYDQSNRLVALASQSLLGRRLG